jgi:hypothetical protein
MRDMQREALWMIGGTKQIKLERDYAGGWQVELAGQYGIPVQYDYSTERGRREMGNHHFHGGAAGAAGAAVLVHAVHTDTEGSVAKSLQQKRYHDR